MENPRFWTSLTGMFIVYLRLCIWYAFFFFFIWVAVLYPSFIVQHWKWGYRYIHSGESQWRWSYPWSIRFVIWSRKRYLGILHDSFLAHVDRRWLFLLFLNKFVAGVPLVVNSSWKNPTGEWRVGCKLVYELFTDTLTSRVKVAIRNVFSFLSVGLVIKSQDPTL